MSKSSFRAIPRGARLAEAQYGCWRRGFPLSRLNGRSVDEGDGLKAKEPIFNVPPAVIGMLGLMAGVHASRALLSSDQDNWFVIAMAFIPARYAGLAAELPGGSVASFTSPFTHMAVHGDIVHLIFNSAWLLAFGSAIAKRVGGLRFLALFLFCGLAGVLAFLVVHLGELVPVVGASGAISGLMAAVMRFLFSAMDDGGLRQLREDPSSIRLMGLGEAFRDRRLLLTTGVWLLLNVLAMVGIGTLGVQGAIAWEAHVGGYLAGLFCFGLFDPKPGPSSQPHNKPTLN